MKQEGIAGIYRGLFPVVSLFGISISSTPSEVVVDDASRRQLRRSFYHVRHAQATGARYCASWTTPSQCHHVRYRCYCRFGHSVHHDASRVRCELLPYSLFVFTWGGSVVKTRMQALDARAQYRNSFHCAYRIFTEEGFFRFWTGTTPRLARLVVRFHMVVRRGSGGGAERSSSAEWWHCVHGLRKYYEGHFIVRNAPLSTILSTYLF